MSVLHADNFSAYGGDTAFMTQGVYGEVDCNLVDDPDDVSEGQVMLWRGSNANATVPFRYVLQSGVQNVVGVSSRVWLSNLPADNGGSRRLRFKGIDNKTRVGIGFASTGALTAWVRQADEVTDVAYTSPLPAITAKGWYHMEVRCTLPAPGQCSIEVRIEGRPILLVNAVPVFGGGIAQVDGFNDNLTDDSYQWYTKDLVVWDGAGPRNNDFLGSVLVATMKPIADISLNWTPNGAGNGFSILDNTPPVDAQYLSAVDAPLPAPYVAELSDLPDEITTVRALVTMVRAAKTDGGDGSLQVGLISSPAAAPATVLGVNRPITVAQTFWRDVFETDPKTGVFWTPAAADLSRLQINRTL